METGSRGMGLQNIEYREMLENLINQKEWRKAMAIEMRDVRRIAREAGDPRRYNEALKEMLEYFKCLEKNGLL
jgi:CRISPR/Cas system Type II protein with McrA/HNH and RuvC-like nuclease domain